MLRARTPSGVEQEIYALLVTYQALRVAISDAVLTRPDVDPDRCSFGIALHAARDQLITAMGVLTDTAPTAVISSHVGRKSWPTFYPHAAAATTARGQTSHSVYAAEHAAPRRAPAPHRDHINILSAPP